MDLGWNMPMLSYRNRTVSSGINQNVRPLRRSFSMGAVPSGVQTVKLVKKTVPMVTFRRCLLVGVLTIHFAYCNID